MAEAVAQPKTATRTFPVIEVFGPTIQGEGRLAGLPTHFVRFGGCDFRCSWCDSMYAVEPALVKLAERLSAEEITDRLSDLGHAGWVTLSGGNPALLDLGGLVHAEHQLGRKVAVETQGSRWKDWLGLVDCLTVSPKPPSSEMVSDKHDKQFDEFMCRALEHGANEGGCIKVVVFDPVDLEWASAVIAAYPEWPAFLSVGTNPVGKWGSEVISLANDRQVRDEVGDRYRWLCEAVAGDMRLSNARVLPQLHVLAWGHSRGV